MGILSGKAALVTGAGGGIGRAHALLLAKEGASVVVNDLGGSRDGTGKSTNLADQVVEEIKKAGGKAVANYDSVTDAKGAQNMVAAAVKAFGKLDILIANAGILRDKTFKNMTEDMWDIVIQVHLKGTYHTVKAAYDQMIAQNVPGRIILTSSTSGLFGNFGQTNYGAAKAGIAGLMRCLWPEAKKYGITVNVLAPAALTRLTEDLKGFGDEGGQGRKMLPEMVSPAVIWLCSDDAAEVTGRQFLVAGNTVSLIEPQTFPIAKRSNDEKPWDPRDIGAEIQKMVKGRPYPGWRG